MKTDELLQEIRDINLRYLLLAQYMLRDDKDAAIVRLGISADCADLLASLSTAQVMKLASTNSMLSRFRFDDVAILSMLTDETKSSALSKFHASILLSGQEPEFIA